MGWYPDGVGLEAAVLARGGAAVSLKPQVQEDKGGCCRLQMPSVPSVSSGTRQSVLQRCWVAVAEWELE